MVDGQAAAGAAPPDGATPVAAGSLSRASLLRILRRNRPLLDRFGVRRLALFGSHAAGTQKPDSDIDLYVEFDAPTYANYLALAEALEGLFGRKVELLTRAGLESIRVPAVAQSIRWSLVFV